MGGELFEGDALHSEPCHSKFVRPIGLTAGEIPFRRPAVIHVQAKTHRIVPISGCGVAVYEFSLEHEPS